ncbi:MAG: hypothetical protein ACRDKU_09655 [Gaiellaceae bacterium]
MAPGELCSVEWGVGNYRVVKILVVEDGLVHLRLYANRFRERPFTIDPSELRLAVEHVPLEAQDFAAWIPGVIGYEPVEPEELARFEIWQSAGRPTSPVGG